MQFPKPVNFRPADRVRKARFSDEEPPFLNRPARHGRKQQGILYEQRCHAYLGERYSVHFLSAPWIIFEDALGLRWCQPDGIIFDVRPGRIICTEIKLRHCSEAYFQLFELYIPVLSVIFPKWSIRGCEVCRWFDPKEPTPEAPTMRKNPVDALEGKFNVHIFMP